MKKKLNIRGKMTEALCIVVAVSMTTGQPVMALGENHTLSETETVLSEDAETVEFSDTEESEDRMMEIPETESQIVFESVPETDSETEVEAEVESEQYRTNLDLAETEVKMTEMPVLEEGKTYTVPFRMYKASSIVEDENGKVYADYSMGEICVESFDAEIKVKNGKVTMKIKLLAESACAGLNYFDSQADYYQYVNSEEQYLPEIQNLKKGGTVDHPKDGVIYTYEATDQYYEYDKALTSMTFTLPTTSPLLYFTVRAAGMDQARSEQFGAFGFDYDNLREVDSDVPVVPGKPDTPENPEGSGTTEVSPESVRELDKAIEAAEQIDNLDQRYSGGSFKNLQVAIQKAKELKESTEITNEKVQESIDILKQREKQLVVISDLKKVIDRGEELLLQTDQYTAASLAQLKASLNTAKVYYYQEFATQSDIDLSKQMLESSIVSLIPISAEELDPNNLPDGLYTVSVNLWHADQDKESMGNTALYHTADLNVLDGRYLLRISGHQMTTSGQTGELDAIRIVPDGSKPMGDGSNYRELGIQKDGSDYFIDVELENPTDVSEYYYAGIKVHTINDQGEWGYPMGKNWINNRLRISWDSLAFKENSEDYPAFSAMDSATGIRVSAKEGALPKGTQLKVEPVSDPETLQAVDQAISNLAEKYTPYRITLYKMNNGVEEVIEPRNEMELTINMPIPADYDTSKAICYYLDENNYANVLKGALNGNTYTVANNKIGIYAISQKKTREPSYVVTPDNKPSTRPSTNSGGRPSVSTSSGGRPVVSSGGKPTVSAGSGGKTANSKNTRPTIKNSNGTAQTGDETNVAAGMMTMMGALTVIAGLLVLFRRKKR